MDPNTQSRMKQQADAAFMNHLREYDDDIKKLTKKSFSAKEINLLLISKVAAGAEECDVIHQMSHSV